MKQPPARYIMVGGFLGAGKTTAILKLAEHLKKQGQTVGLITNDQGTGLVDTAMDRASEFPVEEISGGCFCCRFNSLVDATKKLAKTTKPDVFIAEPVGSCTDLMATVTLPMQQLYGANYKVAPLSVLVDPIRAMRVLGIGDGRQFAPKVTYIYRKQLEEANLLVVNKCDLLDVVQMAKLKDALKQNFPRAEVLVISARKGTGMSAWFKRCLTGELSSTGIMDVDYITYGVGEAMLGWLNALVRVKSAAPLDGNKLLRQVAETLRAKLAAAPAEVAHLKMTLSPTGDPLDIAVINLVRTDATPEMSFQLADHITDGELTVNLRAEASPAVLEKAVRAAAAEIGRNISGTLTVTTLASFKPGQPNPTHRVDAAGVEHRPVLP
jgi:Ni2+-binding GTPase involved in maturation of urease and hydrogenase